jgi:hypothetical protein
VRIFGPSTLLHDDLGEGRSLLALTQRALETVRSDVEWKCGGSVLYIAPGMTERVLRSLETDRPDLVVLRLPQNQWISDYVVYRVRELWPGMYRRAVSVASFLIRLAGGGPDGAPTPRGWVFRVPRWFLGGTIGVAPAVRVEDAVALVKDTIDAVLKLEDVQLLYLMSSQTVRPTVPEAEAARRRDYFVRTVAAHCDSRGIPWADPTALRIQAGLERRLSSDGWHTDLENRELDAGILAEAIIQTLDGRRHLTFSASAARASL